MLDLTASAKRLKVVERLAVADKARLFQVPRSTISQVGLIAPMTVFSFAVSPVGKGEMPLTFLSSGMAVDGKEVQ